MRDEIATLHDLIERARRRFEGAGIAADEARFDAEVLARHVLGWDRATLLTRRQEPEPPGFTPRYDELLTRREAREPVARITGHREFWGLDFEIAPAAFVPRPETELIIEEAQVAFAGQPEPVKIVDVGTGSGCLAVALAREFPSARVLALDVSSAALDVARRNSRRHDVDDRIRFVQADLLTGLRGRADLVVSNPPYVPDEAAANLPPEVRDHDPAIALFAGEDGLDLWRRLVAQAAPRLRPAGLLIGEFGLGQEPAVREIFASHTGWAAPLVRRDLQGIPRVIVARRGTSGSGDHDVI